MLTAVDFDRSGWRTPHPERWRAKVWPSPLADACIEVSQRSRALVACPILFVCSAMALVEPWPALRMRDPGTERDGVSPYGIFVRFAAYTGLRAGELVALRVSDLNFAARTVHVQRTVELNSRGDVEGPPKSAAGDRVVGIPEGLWDDLIDYLGARRDEPAAAVFLAPDGRRFSYGTFYSLHFRPAVRAALPERLWGLRVHDLRHTYASLLVAMGAHPKEMAERLGHCSVRLTLDRYSHLLPERDTDLTSRLDVEYRRQTARKDVVQETTPEPPGQSI